MSEEEPFVSARMMSAFAGGSTCLTILYALFAFSGAYDYEQPFIMTWFFSCGLVTSLSPWLDVAGKREKISNWWVRNSQAILVITHIMFGFLLLLNILLP